MRTRIYISFVYVSGDSFKVESLIYLLYMLQAQMEKTMVTFVMGTFGIHQIWLGSDQLINLDSLNKGAAKLSLSNRIETI